jgi:hypothetical protein
MYFRVATQGDKVPTWQWKSSVRNSLNTLFQLLRPFHTLPHDQLRIFCFTREGQAEQLERENEGLAPTSVTVAQYLRRNLCV